MHLAQALVLAIVSLSYQSNLVSGCPYRFTIGPSHTLCVYQKKSCAGQPLLKSGGLTSKDRNFIINLHNDLRSLIAKGQLGLPPAADMRVLVWDWELEEIAQRWADQCTDGHDQLRDIERYLVGQNVAITWTFEYEDEQWKSKPDWESQIRGWFDEYSQHGFQRSHIKPFQFKPATGHFTQLVWGETRNIGCGYAYYKHRTRGYTKIYVCNYGPSGNIIGGEMYNISHKHAPICNHPLKPSQKYSGLCESKSDQQRTTLLVTEPPVKSTSQKSTSIRPSRTSSRKGSRRRPQRPLWYRGK